MATYVNPQGYVAGTAQADTFIFNVPLQSFVTIDAFDGVDQLFIDWSTNEGSYFRAGDIFDSGRFYGVARSGPYGPQLTFHEVEDVRFTGSAFSDHFDITLKPNSSALLVDIDGGGGVDALTMDVRSLTSSVILRLENGVITSNVGAFASLEHFVISTGPGNDILHTGDENDRINAGGGSDEIVTGRGDDQVYAETGGDYVDMGAGYDFFQGNYAATAALHVEIGDAITVSNGVTALNVEATNIGTGSGDDSFNVTRELSGTLYGGLGNDTLTYVTNSSQAQQFSVAGFPTYLDGNALNMGFTQMERVILKGGALGDQFVLRGIFSQDAVRFEGGDGVDRLEANFSDLAGTTSFIVQAGGTVITNRGEFIGIENFQLTGGSAADILTTQSGNDSLSGGGGNDLLQAGSGIDVLSGGDGNDQLSGGADDDYLYGDAGDDVLEGGGGTDQLFGRIGHDVLDGGAGADEMTGETGDDTYVVDDAGDVVIEVVGGGNDLIYARVSYALAGGQAVETLSTAVHAGTGAIDLTGNAFDNRLIGNFGANLLNGNGGADRMTGLNGDDIYVVDDAGDVVIEGAGGGNDRVYTRVSHALTGGQEIETLSTAVNAGTEAIDLVGNEYANTLIGNFGANYLNGNSGADTMVGLAGDDVYVIDDGGDVVLEGAGGGNDFVFTRVSHALAGGQEIETLSTAQHGGTQAIDLIGNEFANTLIGNYGANYLNGGAGADTLTGLNGDDIYVVDDGGDVVNEAAGGGSDLVFTRVSYALGAGQAVETLSTAYQGGGDAIDLTGNEFANTLIGNFGANLLDGKGGGDTLQGLNGADQFAFTTALGSGNVDTILDFSAIDDTILLDDAVFTALAPGALASGAFVTGSAAQDADDRIIYDSATGALSFDADGNGAGAAVQFATLSQGLALSANDFAVI